MTAIRENKPLGFPWETQDPFLFCAYHRDEYPKGNGAYGPEGGTQGRMIGQDFTIKDGWRMYHGQTMPGFPYHPHRGFETITINKEGVVDHSDSLGASGRFMAGDVQWMTAGKGVQHSEMFPLINTQAPNPLEIFQIWLNLPRASKFVEPHFKMLWNESIPKVAHHDSKGATTTIELIAGHLNGTYALEPTPDSWAADPTNGVQVWTIEQHAGASFVVPSSREGLNRSLYIYKGTATIEGEEMGMRILNLDPTEALEIQAGPTGCFMLFLEGRPIGEPVVQYGPFVMNSQEEIQEAFSDYQRTEFGGWPWPEKEQSHGSEVGRFAKHADGRLEQP